MQVFPLPQLLQSISHQQSPMPVNSTGLHPLPSVFPTTAQPVTICRLLQSVTPTVVRGFSHVQVWLCAPPLQWYPLLSGSSP